MIRNAGKTLLLGAAVAATAMLGTFATAEAKHGHRGHHGWYRPYFYVAPVYATSYGGSCSYFYWRWRETGARYWRHRYHQCIY